MRIGLANASWITGQLQTEQIGMIGWQYVRIIRRIITRFDTLSRDLVQPFGLTNMQAMSLMFISRRPGTTQANLVAALDSDAAAISATLKKLEQRELVIRRRVDGNARANALTLSASGTATAQELQVEFDKLAAAVGKTIPSRGDQIIHDWLKSILAIHDL